MIIINGEGDKIRGNVNTHDVMADEKFMLRYNQMNMKLDENVANYTIVHEARNRISDNHKVKYMGITKDGSHNNEEIPK